MYVCKMMRAHTCLCFFFVCVCACFHVRFRAWPLQDDAANNDENVQTLICQIVKHIRFGNNGIISMDHLHNVRKWKCHYHT